MDFGRFHTWHKYLSFHSGIILGSFGVRAYKCRFAFTFVHASLQNIELFFKLFFFGTNTETAKNLTFWMLGRPSYRNAANEVLFL